MSEWKWDITKTDFIPGINFKDITDKKYGKLTAKYPIRVKKQVHWICECECGNIKEAFSTDLNRGHVKSCGCFRKETTSARNKLGWTGYGDISGSYFSSIKYNAKIRNIKFDITIEYIWELFLEQKRKCALSGFDLDIADKGKLGGTTGSLDRIDSSIGYIEENVQWVHKEINRMKGEMSDKDFITICNRISDHNKND